ncbi:MAG: methylated-DNA--[protein]-cysteine S-methyltransferase [Gemmatimonadota bacterium]|nr:methylated-DNA--[protein]-cysteine S-methyltransferase [Gemmatimonadota bacterium]
MADIALTLMATQYAHPNSASGMTSRPPNRESSPETPLNLSFRDTSLGVALIASSDAGIRAISLGDDRQTLLREWTSHAPEIPFRTAESDEWADSVAAWLDAPDTKLAVPLDIHGTDFQRAVWNALREIPRGATSTYAAIAERIGRPRAIRAVANACAMNSLAVVIPCHRVLRSDGNISGYRWGVDLKRKLLALESSAPV